MKTTPPTLLTLLENEVKVSLGCLKCTRNLNKYLKANPCRITILNSVFTAVKGKRPRMMYSDFLHYFIYIDILRTSNT